MPTVTANPEGAVRADRRGRRCGHRAGISAGAILLAAALAACGYGAVGRGAPEGPTTVAPSTSGAAALVSSVEPAFTWPKIAGTPGDTGLSADPSLSTANAGALGIDWMAGTGAATVSSPVVAWNDALGETLVYLANNAGYLTAFDQSTGATVWSVNLGSQIVSTPLVEGGSLWVSRDYSPVLYKLDAATGAVECSTPLVSTSEGSPTIGTPAGGSLSIYIGVNDANAYSGPVYSIDEGTCAVNWQFTDYQQIAGSWDPLSFATDAAGQSLVLAGTSDPDESIYAINALTGALVWSFKTLPQPGSGNTDIDIGAGVAVAPPGSNGFADGVAYVPGEDGYLYAFDLGTGALLWDTDFGAGLPSVHTARATPALVDGDVVFGEADGVMAVSQATGAPVWTFATGGAEVLSAATALGPAGSQIVAVTTVTGALDVLSAQDGTLLYTYQTPSYSASSVADVDGNLLVASSDGYLYDLAVGGSNGAAPTTRTTYPTAASTVTSVHRTVVLHGTATGDDVTSVAVAIESAGPSGPWWDGATRSWTTGYADNEVGVVAGKHSNVRWSYRLPVPAPGGSYRLLVSAVQSDGLADVTDLSAVPGTADVAFDVASTPGTPTVSATPTWVAPGGKLSVVGQGFRSGEKVTLHLGGTSLGAFAASPTGALGPVRVRVPGTAGFGSGALTAAGGSSAPVAATPVDVSNTWSQADGGPTHLGFEADDPILLRTPSPGPPEFLGTAWSDPTGAPVRTALAVADDVAYYGDDAGTVTAVDVQNGQPQWSTTLPAAVDSSPALDGTQVFVGTEGDQVVALQQGDGAVDWSTPTSSPVSSAPAVADGQLLVGSDDGTVYDMDELTGAVRWTATVDGAVTGSPAVDQASGLVVVGDGGGAVTALSLATGATVWQMDAGGAVTASPTVDGGTVYVGSTDAQVYALDEATGQVVWETTTSAAVTAAGSIYTPYGGQPFYYAVGSADGTLRLLDLASGAVVAESPVGGPVTGLAGSIGWLTVTTSNGTLWGLKRVIEPDWEVDAPAPFDAPATVLDGVVYVGGADASVAAYTVPGTPIP